LVAHSQACGMLSNAHPIEDPMADENAALLEAIDKLTEAVDGVEDALKAHPNAETKAKVTEYLAKVQEGLDSMFKLFPDT
jgi:hypothetical protein